jgi:hypothetical protein
MKLRVQIPLPALTSKNFLASQMSMNFEPFQRTDISTQPLGPTLLNVNYQRCLSALPRSDYNKIKLVDIGRNQKQILVMPTTDSQY